MTKTLRRNMVRKGLDPTNPDSLPKYKAIRKNRKATIRSIQKKNLDKNRQYRREHPRSKKGKKQTRSNVTK